MSTALGQSDIANQVIVTAEINPSTVIADNSTADTVEATSSPSATGRPVIRY